MVNIFCLGQVPLFGNPEKRRLLAGGLGFEPRLTESESAVLPLDDPPNPPGHINV